MKSWKTPGAAEASIEVSGSFPVLAKDKRETAESTFPSDETKEPTVEAVEGWKWRQERVVEVSKIKSISSDRFFEEVKEQWRVVVILSADEIIKRVPWTRVGRPAIVGKSKTSCQIFPSLGVDCKYR
jgi:hypothetical protein